MSSQARQNFHSDSEIGINNQLNLELNSSYYYQALAFHFNRDDIALNGFHNYFKKLSDEERKDAEKLMEYQNKRGGRIILKDVQKPTLDTTMGALELMTEACKTAKATNQAILDLHVVADNHQDYDFSNFLEEHFLPKQVELVKEMSDHLANLQRVGKGLGEYQFDHETLS